MSAKQNKYNQVRLWPDITKKAEQVLAIYPDHMKPSFVRLMNSAMSLGLDAISKEIAGLKKK